MRRHFLLVGAGLVIVAVWLISRWQPERQVRVHTEALLAAGGSRDFKKFASLMAEDYSDSWDQDKARALEGAEMVLRQFLAVDIQAGDLTADAMDGTGHARARITMRGSGGPLAQEAIARLDALKQPFTFTWRQRSWKPWDWELTRVEQAELHVPEW